MSTKELIARIGSPATEPVLPEQDQRESKANTPQQLEPKPSPAPSGGRTKTTLLHRLRGKRTGRLAWGVVLTAWLMLLFAYLWPTELRNRSAIHVGLSWVAFMVRTFQFHGGLLLSAVGVLAILTRRWLLLTLIVPILLWAMVLPVRQVAHTPFQSKNVHPLTVMSINLLMRNTQTTPIIEEVLTTDPDVLLLQEYTPRWHRAFQQAISTRFPYIAYQSRPDSFGLAIYAKRPFAKPVQLHLPLGDGVLPQMRAVFSISEQQELTVYNVHLAPPISLRLFAQHRLELADLIDRLNIEPLPTIVGGDFNFTNDSPHAAALFDAGWHDAHAQAGHGRGTTWPTISWLRYLPGVQIDHLFLNQKIQALTCRTGIGQGSDHRPIVSTLVLR